MSLTSRFSEYETMRYAYWFRIWRPWTYRFVFVSLNVAAIALFFWPSEPDWFVLSCFVLTALHLKAVSLVTAGIVNLIGHHFPIRFPRVRPFVEEIVPIYQDYKNQ